MGEQREREELQQLHNPFLDASLDRANRKS